MVDGLERELEGRASVLRANLQSDAGRVVAARYEITTVPGFVVLDPRGEVVLRVNGARGVPVADVRRAVSRLTDKT